jgi:vacuolar-type H+-ATPase subunit H
VSDLIRRLLQVEQEARRIIAEAEQGAERVKEEARQEARRVVAEAREAAQQQCERDVRQKADAWEKQRQERLRQARAHLPTVNDTDPRALKEAVGLVVRAVAPYSTDQ